MSLSQHALLRLVVRGVVEDDDVLNKYGIMMMMDGWIQWHVTHTSRKNKVVEQHQQRKLPILLDKNTYDRRYNLPKKLSAGTCRKDHYSRQSIASLQNYNVPILFCAGDATSFFCAGDATSFGETIHRGLLRFSILVIVCPVTY